MELEFTKLAPPRIFLVRMLVFLVLCSLIMIVHRPVVPPGDPALSGSGLGQ
jgi:hypothetical protein